MGGRSSQPFALLHSIRKERAGTALIGKKMLSGEKKPFEKKTCKKTRGKKERPSSLRLLK